MTVGDVLWGVAGIATFIAPGWICGRACHLPQPLLAGFAASAVALVTVILTLGALGTPLQLLTVGTAWGFLTAVSLLFWRRTRARNRSTTSTPLSTWRTHWPLLLPLVPMFAVVTYRACAQPLFGVDTVFRWNYLAEQMVERGTLAFYPPVSSADYQIYSWPDGIAPVVSSLYFWIYSIAGSKQPALTAPAVILQFVLVVVAAFALGRRFFCERAAWFAGGLIACCPLIAWATAMGQETGLTAIAVAALLLYLPPSRAEEKSAAMVFAALGASLGALAREYGLVFPMLGLGLCLARRLSPRACSIFLVVTLLATVPWYARNWFLTGNPIFNLSLGNLLPVNEVHRWLNESFHEELGWSNLPPEAPRLFLTNCVSGLLGAAVGAVLFIRRAGAFLITSVVIGALWIASLGYTAAGFIYSLRVLNPALVLATVLGGAALARWVPAQRSRNAVILAMCLFATDASLRTLTLPSNVYRVPMTAWLQVGRAVQDYHERPVYRELARIAGNDRMLVLGPNALLSQHGARTVPLWSPETRFLFDSTLSPTEIVRRLSSIGINLILLNRGSVNERFLAHSAFFRNPAGTVQPVWSDGDMILFRTMVNPILTAP